MLCVVTIVQVTSRSSDMDPESAGFVLPAKSGMDLEKPYPDHTWLGFLTPSTLCRMATKQKCLDLSISNFGQTFKIV